MRFTFGSGAVVAHPRCIPYGIMPFHSEYFKGLVEGGVVRVDRGEPETVGDRLSYLRDTLGWSAERLAEELAALGFSVSQPSISRYERDQRMPGADYILGMALLTGYSADWILGRHEDTQASPYDAVGLPHPTGIVLSGDDARRALKRVRAKRAGLTGWRLDAYRRALDVGASLEIRLHAEAADPADRQLSRVSILHTAMSRLEPDERTLILLYGSEGLALETVSDAIGLPPGQSLELYHAALGKLMKEIDKSRPTRVLGPFERKIVDIYVDPDGRWRARWRAGDWVFEEPVPGGTVLSHLEALQEEEYFDLHFFIWAGDPSTFEWPENYRPAGSKQDPTRKTKPRSLASRDETRT